MRMMIKFLLLSLVVISVEAGKDLMVRECHNADVPTICMQCLESNPASLHANSLGIARIVIHCLDSNLHILTKNITRHLPLEKDETIKTVLQDCRSGLSEAIKTLNHAKKALKTADYDKAGESVSAALDFPLNCETSLQSVKATYSYYFSLINIYGQLSVAAMRIIDRF